MGLISCPETSETNYHCQLRNNAEEGSSQLFFCFIYICNVRHVLLGWPNERGYEDGKDAQKGLVGSACTVLVLKFKDK
jgi:hypothetical protein